MEELGGWTGEIRIIMAGDRDWDELTCVAGARIWCSQMRRPTGRIQLALGGGEGGGGAKASASASASAASLRWKWDDGLGRRWCGGAGVRGGLARF